ncbi:MAG TPA: multifunctional CCA tRNA nucleotidyl transferase/2'3'-cyclic phosphodiesterase/2'nucleotidase/phosphatase [Burkholderiales bacterium]
MKIYVVGGAVRDELLGLPVKDRDRVVVGATPDEMVKLGFKPVGKDFPVFLHPETHEEYALARTERKSGRGYKGFTVYASPEVSLEDDLRRRDLTINAMAKAEDGSLIDPFHGRRDLEQRTLRHVSEAFPEDPVRILRVARFAARFGFEVAKATMELMRKMVDSGETEYLVAERVWQEFSKGLMEDHPERMFDVLSACGFMSKNLPEIQAVPRRFTGSLPMRFAALAWHMPAEKAEALADRLKAPNDPRELGSLASRNRDLLGAAKRPEEFLDLLKKTDAFRRPDRFAELLGVARQEGVETARFERARAAAAAVDAAGIAQRGGDIAKAVDEARLKAIAALR